MRSRAWLKSVLGIAVAWTATAAGGTPVTWVNGDFAASGTGWTFASTTTFEDIDASTDTEAVIHGCGDDGFLLSRPVMEGTVPATTHVFLSVEAGEIRDWTVTVALAPLGDPSGRTAPLAEADPTGTIPPPTTAEPTLAWRGTAMRGVVVLDPARASAEGIDGWPQMTASERRGALGGYSHAEFTLQGCAGGEGVAALDDFSWVVDPENMDGVPPDAPTPPEPPANP